MITLIITLASVMFYFLFGWLAAVRNLPRAWTEARKQWRGMEDTAKESVIGRTICMFLFWIFYLPGRAVSTFICHVVDAGDPKVLEDKVREQNRRIRELEKELGIR